MTERIGPALPFADNVFMDPASTLGWSQLLQTEFLEGMFAALRTAMGAAYDRYTFFLYSPSDPTRLPVSATLEIADKILFFLSDESPFIPSHLREYYVAIFKAHMPFEVDDGCLFPFNLGYVRNVPKLPSVSIDERPVDVFFSGNLNFNRWPLYRALSPRARRWSAHPVMIRALLRSPLRRWLRHKFGDAWPDRRIEITFTDGFAQGLSPDSYGERLAASKIVLCPRGFVSTETFRHVEALRAGAVVVSEPLPDLHFYRGSPIVCVADWERGLAAAVALLDDPEALASRQAASGAWYDAVLSERGTADFVARSIRRSASRGLSVPGGVM